MESWGPGIYQCQIGTDVKAFYHNQLRRGKNGDEVTQMLLNQYPEILSDPAGAISFWLALADTQFELGRLEPAVRETALEILRQGADLELWNREAPAKAPA